MSVSADSVVTKIVDRVFPRMPDFFGMINEQCELVVGSMDVFVRFMETGDQKIADQVRTLEKEGDELKTKNMAVLNRAFATPMDREDIYRAIVTIDEVLNYAKTAVREVEILEITPNNHMAEIAGLIRDGSVALRDGYAMLSTNPLEAESYAVTARKAERNTEKVYRSALAELFDADEYLEALVRKEKDAEANAMMYVIEMFKYREIYRHLSNTSDRLEHAGGVLRDIVVQIA
jgi:predicted phosphate transport protein (TIGR00153 family)